MKKSSRQLVDEAKCQIRSIDAAEALSLLGSENTLFVDLREKGELRREGKIPGAIPVPRGLLEFWVDPDSPYFKQAFAGDHELVLFCAMGWRSALAAKSLSDMGFDKVCDIEGGFAAWRDAGGEVQELPNAAD